MTVNSTTATQLAVAAWPAATSRVLRTISLILLGTLILAVSSKIQVPFWPVPMTMTTFAVFVIGASYGSRLAAATVLAFLAEGFVGLPVFAGPVAGPAYLVGPTAGFLFGYVVCAFVVGLAADRGWSRSAPKLAVAMLAGDALLFAMGFVWLAFFAQLASGATGIGAAPAFAKGVQPFILGDILKIALAALAIPAGWALLGRIRR